MQKYGGHVNCILSFIPSVDLSHKKIPIIFLDRKETCYRIVFNRIVAKCAKNSARISIKYSPLTSEIKKAFLQKHLHPSAVVYRISNEE